MTEIQWVTATLMLFFSIGILITTFDIKKEDEDTALYIFQYFLIGIIGIIIARLLFFVAFNI